MKKLKEKSGIVGIVTFAKYKLSSKRAIEIDGILSRAHNMDPKEYDILVKEMQGLCKTTEIVRKNIVVQTGRYAIARILIGDETYSGAINYGALGTDNTAVAATDTALGTEVKRKLFARRSRTNHQASFDFYYSKDDTNGTYQEFGTFIDGTATADSGQLFNHVLTGGWTKTDQEAMTVSITFSINES